MNEGLYFCVVRHFGRVSFCRFETKYALLLRLLASQQQEYGDRSGYTRQRIICESWIKHAYLSIAMLLLLI